MVQQYVYKPHYDFFIDKVRRAGSYEMETFHLHKKYEIYFQLSGRRTYFIEDSAYNVNTGNLVLIGQDEVHKTGSPDNEPHSRIVLNFNQEYLLPIADRLDGVDLFGVFRDKIKVLILTKQQEHTTEEILNRLIATKDATEAHDVAMRRLLLCEFLLHIRECLLLQEHAEGGSPKISNETIDNVTRFISAHYKEDLNLQMLADKFCLSTFYLSRLFKRVTCMSVTEYVSSVRLHAAKELLENTNMRVEALAQEVGFHTTTHFTRTFKTSIGLSPQSYRKLYRASNDEP